MLKSVLVVDDDVLVREVAVDLFEDLGLTVFQAACATEALMVLDAHPEIALLFSDCRMPGMSGPDLARVAHEGYPHLKIVLVSGYEGSQLRGDWPFLSKPYHAKDISRLVAQ